MTFENKKLLYALLLESNELYEKMISIYKLLKDNIKDYNQKYYILMYNQLKAMRQYYEILASRISLILLEKR